MPYPVELIFESPKSIIKNESNDRIGKTTTLDEDLQTIEHIYLFHATAVASTINESASYPCPELLASISSTITY